MLKGIKGVGGIRLWQHVYAVRQSTGTATHVVNRTAPASQKCKGCEEEAEREFAGTRHEGTPQDIPPGRK